MITGHRRKSECCWENVMMCVRHHLILLFIYFSAVRTPFCEISLPSGSCVPPGEPPSPLQALLGWLTFFCAECVNRPLGAECASTVDLKAPAWARKAVHFIVSGQWDLCWIWCTHTHRHTHTCPCPHAAWNSNKALPYCCQGNVVGSNQSSVLFSSRLCSAHAHTLTPLTYLCLFFSPSFFYSLSLSLSLPSLTPRSSSDLKPLPLRCLVTVTHLPPAEQGGMRMIHRFLDTLSDSRTILNQTS